MAHENQRLSIQEMAHEVKKAKQSKGVKKVLFDIKYQYGGYFIDMTVFFKSGQAKEFYSVGMEYKGDIEYYKK